MEKVLQPVEAEGWSCYRQIILSLQSDLFGQLLTLDRWTWSQGAFSETGSQDLSQDTQISPEEVSNRCIFVSSNIKDWSQLHRSVFYTILVYCIFIWRMLAACAGN